MLFNSFEFIFAFLPLTILMYFVLNYFGKNTIAKLWLVLTSLYFYAFFNYAYLIIIVGSIVVNYTLGELLHGKYTRQSYRVAVFALGVFLNLSVLVYFKYYDFFIQNINELLRVNIPLLRVVLPLGISFFTFQQLSFVVDCYQRKSLKYDFLSYCLFVTFFPQLIAGPIVFPTEMLPQFENEGNKNINFANLSRGLYLFSIGLAKKVLIADSIAVFADAGFDKVATLTLTEAWVTSISYTMQLYFDFSGYCDMAMGVALMFNIVLPLNFNSPYKATDIQDFWRRWHMTLGRFLTNYLYIPLGGSRSGELKTLRNLLIVFLVSGIWHGAGWNFIIWGMLHGVSILIHRIWKSRGLRMPDFLGWCITMFLVNIFWVFFRAKDLMQTKKVIVAMFDFSPISEFMTAPYENASSSVLNIQISLLILIAACLLSVLYKNSMEKTTTLGFKFYSMIEQSLYLIGSILFLNRIANFLYFNF